MKMTRTNSNYWPDELPNPAPETVEIYFLACGCTVQETQSESQLSYATYGDVVSWSPTHPHQHQHHHKRSDSSSSSERPNSPMRAASPTPSASENEGVVRIVDSNFCERASCKRSLVFNKEWNRLWEAHNTEMKAALDDTVAFEEFKARIRKEAKEATEGLLGRMPESTH